VLHKATVAPQKHSNIVSLENWVPGSSSKLK